jgi:hypothetical protein
MNKSMVILFLFLLASSASTQVMPILEENDKTDRVHLREVIAIGQDKIIQKNEVASEMVVVWGNVTVDGTVDHNLVAVGGNVKINGAVLGDLVTVLGSCTLGPTARVRGAITSVLGPFDMDPKAKVDGPTSVFLPQIPGLSGLKYWLTSGLVLGRPLPPRSLALWSFAGLFIALYALLCLFFPQPVQACVLALEARPISSFVLGVVTLMLAFLILIILTATLVGIPIVPFLLCFFLTVVLFGKAALLQCVGQQLGRQFSPSLFQSPLIGLVIGALLFCLLYTVPFIGFIVWGIVTPMGLGAVIWACVNRLHREETPSTGGSFNPPGMPPLVSPLETNLTPPLTEISLPRAGFMIRLGATVLDLVLFVFIAIPLHIIGLTLFAWLAYHVGMWAWKGTTIGGIVF